jgi:fibro-slime domain-containing protein
MLLDYANKKFGLELIEGKDYPIHLFYADRKEGHAQFIFKTNLELV